MAVHSISIVLQSVLLRSAFGLVLPFGLLLLVGCGERRDAFPPNRVYAKALELNGGEHLDEGILEAEKLLTLLFGTPNDPKWPAFLDQPESTGVEPLVRMDRLQRAAGPVRSNEAGVQWGLFREHCVNCHGLAGDGLGPAAALLNPYPRDFRMGVFKWKRTPRGVKPTREDLRRLLVRGVPGTAMPSFGSLDSEEIEILIDYLIYLAVRGEFERQLLSIAAMEIDWEGGEHLFREQWWPNPEGETQEVDTEWSAVVEPLEEIVAEWRAAEDRAPELPSVPESLVRNADRLDQQGTSDQSMQMRPSAEQGKRLFVSTAAGCAFCHGPDGRGEGQLNNYDDWTRDYTVMAGVSPTDLEGLRPLLEVGALKPRPILPRNLTWGVFRGGGAPEELYFRIVHGIDGTPMPAASLQPHNDQGITVDQVWDLVDYLYSLANDAHELEASSVEGAR